MPARANSINPFVGGPPFYEDSISSSFGYCSRYRLFPKSIDGANRQSRLYGERATELSISAPAGVTLTHDQSNNPQAFT